MFRPLAAAALALTSLAVAAPAQASDVRVGVSVSVGQPGFYGRIDIGDMPPPVLMYPQPVVIQPAPVAVVRQPIYLHVPPGHARDWRRHCGRYAACNQPVYFVQDQWYSQVYVPHYHQHRGQRYAPPPQRKFHHEDDRRGRGHDKQYRQDKHDERGKGRGRGRDD